MRIRVEQREWKHESPPGREDCRGQLRWVVLQREHLPPGQSDEWVLDHFATEREARDFQIEMLEGARWPFVDK